MLNHLIPFLQLKNIPNKAHKERGGGCKRIVFGGRAKEKEKVQKEDWSTQNQPDNEHNA